MNFDPTPKVQALQARLWAFMNAQVLPRASEVVQQPESKRAAGSPWRLGGVIEDPKPQARVAGRCKRHRRARTGPPGRTLQRSGGA